MATCGTCHREVRWALEESGEKIALDTLPTFDGPDRFTLQFPKGGGTPTAIPILTDRYHSGYRRHSLTCNQPRVQ